METASWALLGLTLLIAVVDWWAVAQQRRLVEYVAKPATMLALMSVALTIDAHDPAVKAWFVVAITFSLLGDVFLMIPRNLFVFGLGAFLVGHIAYIVGMQIDGVVASRSVLGLVVVAVAMATLGRRIVTAVRASDEPELAAPVVVYVAVISLMVVSAIGSGRAAAMVGATLFYGSDALIAWNRFIEEYPWGRVAIMVTYHLGQIGLVASLAA